MEALNREIESQSRRTATKTPLASRGLERSSLAHVSQSKMKMYKAIILHGFCMFLSSKDAMSCVLLAISALSSRVNANSRDEVVNIQPHRVFSSIY